MNSNDLSSAAAPTRAAETAATTTLARPGYQLADNLWASSGVVFLTGTQALVRLLCMQRQRDAARGLDSRGFVSGYRGSPLGGVDQAIWKARQPASSRTASASCRRSTRTWPPPQVLGTQQRRVRPRARGRWRVRHVVRQGAGRGPRGRRDQARQRGRHLATRRRAGGGGRRPRGRVLVDPQCQRPVADGLGHPDRASGLGRRVRGLRPLGYGPPRAMPAPGSRSRRSRRRSRARARSRPPRARHSHCPKRPSCPTPPRSNTAPATSSRQPHRVAAGRQARGLQRLRARQSARSPGGAGARRHGRHRGGGQVLPTT
jgi:hypothetical protein